jgi:hypothetical protein
MTPSSHSPPSGPTTAGDPAADDPRRAAPAVAREAPPADVLSQPAQTARGGWREQVRSKPGLGQAYRVGVFVLGLLFIALGLGLAVLPGPLTIPPVLIGLWIWSTEFRFAERLLESFKRRARVAWEHSKAHPLSSTLITLGGLAAAGAVIWAVFHFELIDMAKSAVGI